MPDYKLLSGTHRRSDGTRAEPGDTVTLTEAQVRAFGSYRFERADPDDASPAAGDVPDDWDLLRKMAVVYDGDEVHGAMGQTTITEFFETLSETEVAELKRQAQAELNDADTDAADD